MTPFRSEHVGCIQCHFEAYSSGYQFYPPFLSSYWYLEKYTCILQFNVLKYLLGHSATANCQDRQIIQHKNIHVYNKMLNIAVCIHQALPTDSKTHSIIARSLSHHTDLMSVSDSALIEHLFARFPSSVHPKQNCFIPQNSSTLEIHSIFILLKICLKVHHLFQSLSVMCHFCSQGRVMLFETAMQISLFHLFHCKGSQWWPKHIKIKCNASIFAIPTQSL